MTVSSLATGAPLPYYHKWSSRGGSKIDRVIVHHWASTSGGDVSLASPSRDASANYIIYSDGRIRVQVPEERRAWTSGSLEADRRSITVEIQNSSTQVFGGSDSDPRSWAVSAKAVEALTALIVDIARRYGWGRVDRKSVIGHREVFATACPGGFLWNRLNKIAEDANSRLSSTTAPTGAEEEVVVYYVQTSVQGSKYVVMPGSGRKRLIGKAEWNRIRSAEGKGLVVPLITVSEATLKSIPNL